MKNKTKHAGINNQRDDTTTRSQWTRQRNHTYIRKHPIGQKQPVREEMNDQSRSGSQKQHHHRKCRDVHTFYTGSIFGKLKSKPTILHLQEPVGET